jgi:hypothetical protein
MTGRWLTTTLNVCLVGGVRSAQSVALFWVSMLTGTISTTDVSGFAFLGSILV